MINRKFSNGLPSSLKKLIGIGSTAEQIDSIANVTDSKLAKIQMLFRQASNGINKNVKYAVVGDSTRDNSYNEMIDYYASQFAKINVVVFDNASSGQTGYDWGHNVDSPTVNELIADIGTNEESYIVEYSMGINDYDGIKTQAQIKADLKYGLDALFTAKPNVNVLLVAPITTGNTARTPILNTIYEELSSEYGLPLLYGSTPTEYGVIQGNTDYYQDSTHPNKFGSRRIVDYIIDKILPTDLLAVVTIEPYNSGATPPSTDLNATIDSTNGFYLTSTGQASTNADWRRLLPISVEPNFQIRVVHQGNRNDHIFLDAQGGFISNIQPSVSNNERFITIPVNAWEVRINLSSEGATYDALGDVPVVEYYNPAQGLYLRIEDIHAGLNIRNIINKFRNGILVDDYGKVGVSGETLTVDANNKMKWA